MSGVRVFNQTALAQDLIDTMFNLVTSSASFGSVAGAIAMGRTSRYLRLACLWRSHIRYFNSMLGTNASLHAFHPGVSRDGRYKDFPLFHAHCNGYNGTLGPSEKFLCDVFTAIIQQQETWMRRLMGGVVGSFICADHTFQIPSRIRVSDDTTGERTQVASSMHGWMTDKLEVCFTRFNNLQLRNLLVGGITHIVPHNFM